MASDIMETADRKHQEDLQRLKDFRLMDDDFFTKCFEGDTKCVELVLRIVLDMPDLVVLEVHTQVFVENLLGRSVRLDVLASDGAGRKFNMEIQRSDKGAGRKRARFNSSMLDAGALQKSADFDELPETWVIFITERDVVGEGLPVYKVQRFFEGSGKPFGDGTHIVYVNGAYRDDNTPIGKLMHDFSCSNPDDMHYSVLAERTRFFKESLEGVAIMSKVIEDIRKEEREEGRREGMKEGLEKGVKKGIKTMVCNMLETGKYALEEISKLSGLTFDEVKSLQTGQS